MGKLGSGRLVHWEVIKSGDIITSPENNILHNSLVKLVTDAIGN